ncbi:MAG: AI-2E family transporter [Chloroflexota bacterium]|nr:AI-2E family transporter [Chloroflexota bacterium]
MEAHADGAAPPVAGTGSTRSTAPSAPGTGLTEIAAWRVVTRSILFTLGVLFAVWLLVRLQGVVIQVLLSVILAAGMMPLVDRLTRPMRLGIGRRNWTPPRALVVLVLYLLLFAVLFFLGAVLIPPVVSDVEDLVRRLPEYATQAQTLVATLPERYPFLPPLDLDGGLAGQLGAIASQATAVLEQALVLVRVVLGVLSGALNGIFILILALYITQDRERIGRYIVGFMPAARQEQVEGVARRIGERLGGWLRGQIILSVIIGAVTLAGLSAIGVRYAVLLALVAAIGEAVPMVGPIFSAIPAVIVAFFQSPLQGTLTLGLYVIIQQLENNLIVPKVMERAVALHPLAVLVALLAGAELLGVTGAILSVPVAAAFSVVLDEVRRERQERAARKGQPVLDQPALLTEPQDKHEPETEVKPAPQAV